MPWLWDSTPRPPQTGHTFGRRARLGAGSAARRARLRGRHRQRNLGALDGLVEGQRDLGLEVPSSGLGAGTAHAAAGTAARAGAPAPPNRFERMSPKPPPNAARVEAARLLNAERSRAAVVVLALLGIRQHVVCLGDLLEALLGLLVALIAVGVVLAGELAVRLLDLLVGGVLADPEDLVVVGSVGQAARLPQPPRRRARGGARLASRYPRW